MPRQKLEQEPSLAVKSLRVASMVCALERELGEPQLARRPDPLTCLISTILSQNTNDRNRDQALSGLRERFPTWEDVARASPRKIAEAIKIGGLANQKSQRIKDILQWIEQSQGRLSLDFICDMSLPQAMETLSGLKGVGLKTSSVVLLFACGKEVFPVDTHIARICRRTGLVLSKAPAEKIFHQMQELVPPGRSLSFHINLIKLGRTICRARLPLCPRCPIKDHCDYWHEVQTSEREGIPFLNQKAGG
ncbi:base excision DNA repair protein [bacterium (candidate division B38) B3_B38]|nr:MAG: base excision DNA repair protein [bacterium (candidate division B38) B3_B38]